jgi:hypothetical protein
MSILSRIEELEREVKKNRVVTGKGVMVSQTDGGTMLTAVPGEVAPASIPLYYGRIEDVHFTTEETGIIFYRMSVHTSLPYEDSPIIRTVIDNEDIPMDYLGLIPVAAPSIILPTGYIFCGFFVPISLAYASEIPKFEWMGQNEQHTQIFTAITAPSMANGVL